MATALNLKRLRLARTSTSPLQGACSGLPPLEQLLVQGGDGRIALDVQRGVNKYGCLPQPDTGLMALGSSTASVISSTAFAATERLWQRLLQCISAGEAASQIYARELRRLRTELFQLCGVADLAGLDVVFAASGTDLHLIAGRLMEGTPALPGLAVMVDAVETGSGVASALAGRHFNNRAALGAVVSEGATVSGGAMEVVTVALRNERGAPRPLTIIDAEVTELVEAAAAEGRRVLLTLVDVSKTGMIAPSPACALALQQRWPETVEVLVDACQFRLAPATVRAYLQQGFMLALTGSKFVTGPTFSGALFFPERIARQFRRRLLPRALAAYSARAEWPQAWATTGMLSETANFGLLLRWQAALEELRAFRALPEAAVTGFLQNFARVITQRLCHDSAFEAVAVPALERQSITHSIAQPGTQAQCWDQVQTIFPFLLIHRRGQNKGRPLNREETLRVYRLLQQDLSQQQSGVSIPGVGTDISTVASTRYQLGQPVACGEYDGDPVSALRICASARLIVEALADNGIHTSRVLASAMAALDKAAMLV